ncbi:MAG: DegV family protein [Anaerolineales bacterium]|nr:DegV family protein [Anaerolineales bacterium]
MTSPRIAIVTDSTADIPSNEAAKPGIKVVPALITIDGESFLDGENFDRAEFYHRLPEYKSPPTTASPPPALFTDAYTSLFNEGFDKIISIHVSGKLSAIYNMACQSAQAFNDRVSVFDSGQLSLGIGFQVMEAAAAARAGADLTTILDKLSKAKQQSRVIAMVNKLDYLRRSGRVHWLTAGIGAWLHVKMVVGLTDGMVHRIRAVRTRNRALGEIHELVKDWGSLRRLGVMHTGIPDEASQFARMLEPLCENSPIIIEATTVIGTHVGEGSIGIAALTA